MNTHFPRCQSYSTSQVENNTASSDYIFLRLALQAKKIEQKTGKKVLNLAPGVPDIPPSSIYTQKLSQLSKRPELYKYPGYDGTPDFRRSVKKWYKKRFKVTIIDDQILPLLGAKDGISHLPFALLDPEDEMLIPNPGYPAYSAAVKLAGGKPVDYFLTETNNFRPDFKQLEKLVTTKTRAIMINFPANPTGQTISKLLLKKLVDFALYYKLTLVYDNAYSELAFDSRKPPSVLEVSKSINTVVELGSFSKTFAFSGLRMGWVVGNPEVILALRKVKSNVDSGMSLLLQHLGAYALNNIDHNWFNNTLLIYTKRRDIYRKWLKKLGLKVIPTNGAIYLWAKIPDSFSNSQTFCQHILLKKNILLTPGTAFGSSGEGYVRVSLCVDVGILKEYI